MAIRVAVAKCGLASYRFLSSTLAIGGAPVRPLRAIDAPQVAICIRPFIPNGDATFLQPLHICFAAQEPKQFVDDGLEVNLFRGDERETGAQIEPRLRPKERISAGAGAVGFELALVEHEAEEVEIWLHRNWWRD